MPLSGLRVVDLTRILAGPFATMMLGDMGADVVKVERPGTGDDARGWGPPFHRDTSTYFHAVNRGKRSITLNLKADAGRELLWELLDGADVVVSNFRAGVMERLGLGYDEVARRYPRLIYGIINGYGAEGPAAARPSFDVIVQAESGLMDLTGLPDGPPTKVGISLADQIAGMYLVQGILLALRARTRDGRGQQVEIALHDALLSMFTYQAQQYLTGGRPPTRLGNAHPSIVPYQTFSAADGMLVVGVGSESAWRSFCEAMGLAELVDDERFSMNAARVANRGALEAELERHFASGTVAAWIERLERVGVPCGRVRSAAEALDGDLARRRGMVTGIPGTDMRVLGIPVRLSGTPGSIETPAPDLGQHTAEVLGELGYDAARIEALRAAGVI